MGTQHPSHCRVPSATLRRERSDCAIANLAAGRPKGTGKGWGEGRGTLLGERGKMARGGTPTPRSATLHFPNPPTPRLLLTLPTRPHAPIPFHPPHPISPHRTPPRPALSVLAALSFSTSVLSMPPPSYTMPVALDAGSWPHAQWYRAYDWPELGRVVCRMCWSCVVGREGWSLSRLGRQLWGGGHVYCTGGHVGSCGVVWIALGVVWGHVGSCGWPCGWYWGSCGVM